MNTPIPPHTETAICDVQIFRTMLECFRVALLVIDDDRRILQMNATAGHLLGVATPGPEAPHTCHQLLCRCSDPCNDCMLTIPEGAFSQKSHTLQGPQGREVFVREELVRGNGAHVLILTDVTREISVVRKLDLTRKELKAKNVLLEQRRRASTEEKERMERMLDQLSEALVLVDEDFKVLQKNKAAGTCFADPSLVTCYELVGKDKPCDGCPARSGFTSLSGRKITHEVGGRYLTEEVGQVSGGGHGLLLFRDTTRQIQLIEKIREQQDTITRKNALLSNLVGLQTRMQKANEPAPVAAYFLDVFLSVCGADTGIVVISDIRPGHVWMTVQQGLDAEAEKQAARGYLCRDVQREAGEQIPAVYEPWPETRQLDLIGGNGRRVGMLLMPASKAGEGKDELIPLFLEPFGAFIHNRLLLRQLEEKANTDPLTGLYNRGFVDEALAAEKKKRETYEMDYAVIVVDVNRLKQANDVHGHEAGDRLLLTVAELLKGAVRETDLVARTGGDEFLVLLTDTGEAGAEKMVKRLNEQVFSGVEMPVGDSERFSVTVSMGAAGSDKTDHALLVKTADQRMYAAKEAYYQTHKRYR